jgi:hypothetical protein
VCRRDRAECYYRRYYFGRAGATAAEQGESTARWGRLTHSDAIVRRRRERRCCNTR